MIEYFAVAFIHVASRRVWVTPATPNPDATWVVQQARNFALVEDAPPNAMLHLDRDTKFTKRFRETLAGSGFKPVWCPVMAPNTKPHVERWIQALQQECLDAFVILGDKHLTNLVQDYVAYHNRHRAHSALDFRSPNTRGDPLPSDAHGHVVRHRRLGGVLNWYERRAA